MKRLDDKSAWAARAERMREMRLDGKVPKQIARDMGLDVWTVYRSLKASGARLITVGLGPDVLRPAETARPVRTFTRLAR